MNQLFWSILQQIRKIVLIVILMFVAISAEARVSSLFYRHNSYSDTKSNCAVVSFAPFG